MPPFLEAKDAQRETVGFRMCSEVLRYHQLCTAEGPLVSSSARCVSHPRPSVQTRFPRRTW